MTAKLDQLVTAPKEANPGTERHLPVLRMALCSCIPPAEMDANDAVRLASRQVHNHAVGRPRYGRRGTRAVA